MPTAPTLTLRYVEDSDNVKMCQPYLMPFHIDYSGPAPISTYLRVKAAKENIGAPEPPATDPSDAQTTSNTQDTGPSSEPVVLHTPEDEMDTDATPAPVAHVNTVSAPEPSETALSDAQTTLNTQDAGSSSKHVVVDASEDKMDANTTPVPVASSSLAKCVTDATTRLISSFRGRTIQGLKAALPEGYVGVVLRGDDALGSKARDKKGKGPVKDTLKKSAKRATRGRNKVADDEPEFVDDESMNVDEDEENRTLSIASQFSSFVLWHADHPVDEGRDEYLRSLNEWTQLAHLIHQVEE